MREQIKIEKNLRIKMSLVHEKVPGTGTDKQSLYKTLCYEDSEDFYNYLDWLDLASISKTLVLPRKKHFFYSATDFQGLEVVINLKSLNKFSELNYFLKTIYNSISDHCYFTGYFNDSNNTMVEIPKPVKYLETKEISDIKYKNNNASLTWLSDKLAKLFIADYDNALSRDSVRKLLKKTGFTVHDITELNGKTYFCVQKRPVN